MTGLVNSSPKDVINDKSYINQYAKFKHVKCFSHKHENGTTVSLLCLSTDDLLTVLAIHDLIILFSHLAQNSGHHFYPELLLCGTQGKHCHQNKTIMQ